MDRQVSENSTVEPTSAQSALRFVVLMGLVSLFSDFTYQGARSITGPFLALLGASGTVVGIVAGCGELIGYVLRIVSGYVADRTRQYWSILFFGYGLNLLTVPLLALAGRWEIAAGLIVAERIGKAIRVPARDAMLAHGSARIGKGWGFGLHRGLDQIGAVLGPLVVGMIFLFDGGYRAGFLLLLMPALLALGVLVAAQPLYPKPSDIRISETRWEGRGFPRKFWIYLVGAGCIAAGYADFPLVAYHFKKASVAPDAWIPILYALAMGVDGAAGLFFGRLFDKTGFSALIAAVLLSSLSAPLVFLGGLQGAIVGMILWGIGMGAHGSIMRAAVSDLVPVHRLGIAFGVFNTGYGLFWFLGSVLMGMLYDSSVGRLVLFSVIAQLVSVPLLLSAWRTRPGDRT